MCALCLTDEVEAWLSQQKTSLVPKLKDHVMPLLERIRTQESQKCSFCLMETRYITCLYCYTKYVYDWLEQTDRELSKEFLEFFKDFLTKPKQVYA